MNKKYLLLSLLALPIIFIIVYLTSYEPEVGQVVPQAKAEYVTAPENNTYKIGVRNYQPELNVDITADQP